MNDGPFKINSYKLLIYIVKKVSKNVAGRIVRGVAGRFIRLSWDQTPDLH